MRRLQALGVAAVLLVAGSGAADGRSLLDIHHAPPPEITVMEGYAGLAYAGSSNGVLKLRIKPYSRRALHAVERMQPSQFVNTFMGVLCAYYLNPVGLDGHLRVMATLGRHANDRYLVVDLNACRPLLAGAVYPQPRQIPAPAPPVQRSPENQALIDDALRKMEESKQRTIDRILAPPCTYSYNGC